MTIGIMSEVASDIVIIDPKPVTRKQYQWREVRRPQDSILLAAIKDVPNGQVVAGEDEFTLKGLPYGHCPIPDQAPETIRAPPLKGSRDNGDVRVILRQLFKELVDYLIPIV
jgi:hypothetical protein